MSICRRPTTPVLSLKTSIYCFEAQTISGLAGLDLQSFDARKSLKKPIFIHLSLTNCSKSSHCLGLEEALMAFQPDDLDENIDFTKDFTTTPQWIVGRGQYVYWKECNVISVEKDSEGEDQETKQGRNGQGMVPSGTELYLSGIGGKVKEEG